MPLPSYFTALFLSVCFICLLLLLIGCFLAYSKRPERKGAGIALCAAAPGLVTLLFLYMAFLARNSPVEKWLSIFTALFFLLITACIPLFYAQGKLAEAKLEDLRRRVVKTKFVDSFHTVTPVVKSHPIKTLGGAMLGDAIAGPWGAIIGAAAVEPDVSVREKREILFMVYYADGSVKSETVNFGSDRYKLYMEKLEPEGSESL